MIHLTTTSQIFPLESGRVGLINLEHHHNGAQGAEEVIEHHAFLYLLNSVLDFCIIAVTAFVFEHQILFGEMLNLRLGRPILQIVCNTALLAWVSIVTAPLVEIVCQVVVLWVPHCKFIIDEHQLGIVF